MKVTTSKALLPLAGLLLALPGGAQIERLSLDQMVARADHGVVGHITQREVFRVDHPVDGPELYFTRLTIEGTSAYGDQPLAVQVLYHGGFIDRENGVHNSEAPSADDVRLGNRVLAFYKATDNMGGDVAGNALFAAHGGIYRVVEGRQGAVVLGRGEGYAIRDNVRLNELQTRMARIRTR